MRESLRVRLVLWYALVLTLVVVLYGGAVVYQSWRSMIAGVDAELEAYAREVSKALKPVEGGRFDLELPTDAAAYFFRREGGRPYYVIWGRAASSSISPIRICRWDSPATPQTGRREMSLQAAGGATVLVGRDIADLRRAQWGLFLNVAARRHRHARGRDFRRLVRGRPRAGADQAHQPDRARDVGGRSRTRASPSSAPRASSSRWRRR